MAGNRGNKVRFQVQQDIFDPKSMLDEDNFYAERHGSPAELTAKLTWLLGDKTKSFPLALATMGDIATTGGLKSNKRVKELDDFQYTWPVMSRLDKAVKVAVTNSTADQGIGQSTFQVTFEDNWFKRNYMIESPLGVQAYIIGDGVKVSEGFQYTLQLNAVSDTTICPASELVAGALWCDLNTFNAQSESHGTEFKRVAPGKMKNQMSLIRASHSWSGNSAHKVMRIAIDRGDSEPLKLWMDFELYQFEKRWLEDVENLLWYSRYNRKLDGSIVLRDYLSGKEITTGAGILEQVNNYTTYTRLTYTFLQNVVANALFGQSDTDGMSITLWTGRGGMREFDRAMKEGGTIQNLLAQGGGNIADKFVKGDGSYDLVSTGFFNAMYHIDGYYIKVKHNPIFDYGRRALKSPLHPETGFPLESYRMVFIDDGEFDGEPNLQFVAEKGRRMLHGTVIGLTNAPRQYSLVKGSSSSSPEFQGLLQMASDKDAASYHRLATAGANLRRGNTSLHLQISPSIAAL